MFLNGWTKMNIVSSCNVEALAQMSRTAEIFGLNLKNLRKELRLSQADIARALSVSSPTVSQWESGKYLPDSDVIDRLIDYLGSSPSEMFGTDELAANKRIITLPEALRVINENWPDLAIKKRSQKS